MTKRFWSARERVLQHLALAAAGPDGRTIPLERHLKDVAADLGLTRKAFYRILAALEHDGVITRTATLVVLLISGSA
ncbi:MAG TPA: helix-turn-helix domain-containing protein [Geminicoccaceae bacterium]|nr:helix-turn-helix domain-containing protein [Geminicoccaceae bacterium]